MMMEASNKWKRKVDALIRLAEDQRGKPEGNLAREKLAEILRNHPEAACYKPLVDLTNGDLRIITTKDVAWMNRNKISTDGSWTGRDLAEALAMMEADYRSRILLYKGWVIGEGNIHLND